MNVTTATRDERLETIKVIVCDILEIEEDEVSEVSLFKEDHNADSLRAIEILAALEKEFRVVINQSELPRMVNLKGVYEVVSEPPTGSRFRSGGLGGCHDGGRTWHRPDPAGAAPGGPHRVGSGLEHRTRREGVPPGTS